MANIRGITIEIGGDTTQLTKALSDVDKSLKSTQNDLKDVNKLLKVDPSNIELLRQKQTLLNKSIEDTKSRLQTLKDAQAQMDANGIDKNSAQYQNLQREIMATEQKLSSLESEAAKCNPRLESLAASADQISGKFKEASDAIAPFSAAAGGALAGLVGLGYKAVTSADDLNTLSKQTGISTDELQKFQFASDRIDVSLDTLTGSLTKMKKNMASSSKDTVETWQTLGVSVTDATGAMRPATEVFYDAVQALSQVENETERDQMAMQLFGKSADQLAGVIDDGGAALQEYGTQAEEMGLILSGDTLNSINETNDKIDEMKATFGAAMMQLGATVAEVLAPVVEKVSGFVSGIAQKLSELSPMQAQIVMIILAIVAALAPLLAVGSKIFAGISLIMTKLTALQGFVTTTLIPMITGLSAPVLAVIAVIAALGVALVALYATNEDFRNKVNAIWEQIKTVIGTVIELIKSIIKAFIQVVQAAWQAWGDNILNIAKSIWNFIFTEISVAIQLIQNVLNVVMAVIRGDWQGAWEGIKKLASDLWNGIKAIIEAAINAVKAVIDNVLQIVKGIWETVWNAFKDKVTEIWNAIKTTVQNMVDGIKEKINLVKETITTNIGAAMDFIKELPSKALQWGKDLIANFVDGLKSKWESLKNTVSDFAGGIADFIGFSEPEKGPLSNFHTFAPDMMKLYAQGIKDNAHLVTDQLQTLAGTMSGDMSGGMATVNVTSNTYLDGRLIASRINSELGAML